MKLTLKLFATFREGRFKIEERQYPEGVNVRDIIEELGIDACECGILMVNGRHAALEQELCEGDSLSLFPKVGGG